MIQINASQGSSALHQVQFNQGTEPITCQLSTSQPGITIGSDRIIRVGPTVPAGTYNFAVICQNCGNQGFSSVPVQVVVSASPTPVPAPTPTPTPTPTPVSPVITSGGGGAAATPQTVASGQPFSFLFTATGDGPLTWSIAAGSAGGYSINPSTGLVTAPAQTHVPGGSNTRDVTVVVSGPAGTTPDTQTMQVTIQPAAGVAPVITSGGGGAAAPTLSFQASTTTPATSVYTVQATGTAPVTYSLLGADAAQFTANSSTGEVRFAANPTYTAGGDNIRDLILRATNAFGFDDQTLQIRLTGEWPPVIPVPIAPATHTAMAPPPYLGTAVDTRWPDTELLRVSPDSGVFDGGPWNNFGPQYALQQHWSKNGTYLIVRSLGIGTDGNEVGGAGPTSLHLVNGNTGAYLGSTKDASNRGLPTQWLWSQVNDDEIVFREGVQNTTETPTRPVALQTFNAATKTFGILKTFSPTYDRIANNLSGLEYSQSPDGSLWTLLMRKPTGQWYIVVWDRTTDTVIREWAVGPDMLDHNFSFGISPKKTYLWVIDGIKPNTFNVLINGVKTDYGVTVYSIATGAKVSYLDEMNGASSPTSHTGPALDSAGNEVWVHFWGAPGSNLDARDIRTWRMDGSQASPGTQQCVQGLSVGLYYLVTFVPGWVLVSDYPFNSNNTLYAQQPMRNHCFALKLDGSKQVHPVGDARFSTTDYSAAQDYNFYPWFTPNRDMSKVFYRGSFDLDWSAGGGGLPPSFHAIIAQGV